jgi:hypothetical protein
METINYLKHLVSFEIDDKYDSLCKIVTYDELKNSFPLNIFEFKLNEITKKIVTPKYFLGLY